MMELLVLWRCWYSQEQETVIQSRRGGVTKIASRSVRGGEGGAYIGGGLRYYKRCLELTLHLLIFRAKRDVYI